MGDDQLISIASAAERFTVSRRTVERWIRDGLLAAEVSTYDRRIRLVNANDVQALVAQRLRPKMHREGNLNQPGVGARENGCEELDYRAAIDMTLQLVYSYDHRVISQLYPPAIKPITLEQLRKGPLGQDLETLADLAQGKRRMPKKRILAAIDAILQVLLWPAATDDYVVPRSFWDIDIGRLLGRVKRQAYGPEELMSIGAAARALGVSRLTVYQWLDVRTLDFVPDETTGWPLVVRRSVDDLKRLAAEFSAQE